MTAAPLSPRKKRFCEEYIFDLNGTEAAIRAQYSAATAAQKACNLLREPAVRDYINRLKAERAERLKVTTDMVLADLEVLCAGAVAAKQYGPAVKAKELQGKHLGMFIDPAKGDSPPAEKPETLARGIAGNDEELYTAILRTIPRPPSEQQH